MSQNWPNQIFFKAEQLGKLKANPLLFLRDEGNLIIETKGIADEMPHHHLGLG